ncbi:Mu transposase C-terminal domain-containing protein [Tahibacter soli]|uniref:Mu transposase C-terminal domain-containing protein n=1 Tax=Tahibacter soli TaxID=2983605 RepID=A0A9X3YHD9_9GAMM|nr:Mu transposase C-terminal domain-containing protein [Tahibacter soli]MDC8012261.1 Mu transposase C-terminal domain-containing protein [Tahibacter soli]
MNITPEAWYSAAELAGLAGMPQTHSAVVRLAKREGWSSRSNAGRGGGLRYAITSLPAQTQRELRRQSALSAANTITSEAFAAGQSLARRSAIADIVDEKQRLRQVDAGAAKAAGLSGKSRDRMDAKLLLLMQLEQFAATHRMGICAAIDTFCAAYGTGELAVPAGIRDVIGADISAPTLRRWRRALRTQGAAALAGNYGNRAGSGTIESSPELLEFVVGMLVERPHINAKHVDRGLRARFGDSDTELPNLRTVQRFISSWKAKNAQAFLAIANPDAWKNRHMLAVGSADEGIDRLNQRWEFDSTPADVMLIDGRHTIIGVIDVWSRRALLYVAKVSSSAGVCQAIRRAILQWGVLETAKLDNGQDYVSHRVQRVFAALGVNVNLSAPFSPWQKPHIERFFHTFSHDVLELLPGFTGHNVAEAQALRASKSFAERLLTKNETVDINLTAAELQTFCDRWCRDIYATEPRHGLNGASVVERVAQWRGEVRRISDERALDLLLAEAPDGHGARSVTKKGLRVDGHYYAAPELGALVGERVQVMYDERDIGRIVVYHDDAFVCVAECPEILGVSRAEVAAIAKARQQEEIAAKRKALKGIARKANVQDIAYEILDAKQREANKVAMFPTPSVAHLTPAIEAARDAAQALDAVPATDAIGPTTLVHLEALRDVARADQAQDETAEDRFRRALTILMQADDPRSDIERAFLRRHIDSSEFKGRWSVFEDFGPSAFQLSDDYAVLLPDGAAFDRLRRARAQGENL